MSNPFQLWEYVSDDVLDCVVWALDNELEHSADLVSSKRDRDSLRERLFKSIGLQLT